MSPTLYDPWCWAQVLVGASPIAAFAVLAWLVDPYRSPSRLVRRHLLDRSRDGGRFGGRR